MMQSDKLVSISEIKPGVMLERVINHAGVPYSAIIINGVEMYSAPTANEAEMLKWYNESESEEQ